MNAFLAIFFSICVVITRCTEFETYDENEPLFLTPLIEKGRIQEAKQLAEVKGDIFLNTTSYSGFFTVNKTHSKNLFAWFFPSENVTDPVMLWLQGGPGLTSSFGLFAEIGPFKIESDKLTLRNYSWTKAHNILFVDNPVGTGYSFAKDDGLARDEQQIADELFELLVQFFQLFNEFRENRFYVAGESYAGKYVPIISHKIFRENTENPKFPKINLQGLSIGNGWLDPVNQMNMGEYAFQHGLVDVKTKKMMDERKMEAVKLLREGKFVESTLVQREITKIFKNASGFQYFYNYMLPKHQDTETIVTTFIQKDNVRKAIHVGNLTFNSDEPVDNALLGDIMISVAHILADLLESFKVLIYSGQLDLAVPYPTTIDYLLKLKFSAADEYRNAKRIIWYKDGDIAGYLKMAGNLREMLILKAGHLVPMDQPAVAFEMINNFTTA